MSCGVLSPKYHASSPEMFLFLLSCAQCQLWLSIWQPWRVYVQLKYMHGSMRSFSLLKHGEGELKGFQLQRAHSAHRKMLNGCTARAAKSTLVQWLFMFPSNVEGERLNDVAIMENEYDLDYKGLAHKWGNRPEPVSVELLDKHTV